VVTELPPGMPALQHHFPRRNRLIAALSRGTLVVEAAVHSGSLITARLAAELGREVFAIPGSIHSPMARGCHALIRDGAKLVESADDVLDDLAWGTSSRVASADAPSRAGPAPEDPHADVWRALGDDPVPLELLAASTGRAAGDLLAALLELELRRHVERLPGNRYQRLHGA
jgi:DNA processing protein